MSEHDDQDRQTGQETAPQAPQAPQGSQEPAEAPTALGGHATGDIVIDAALQDLQDAPAEDLDAQIEAGQRVQQTLQARLGDLGE